jgi:hypothetical protein
MTEAEGKLEVAVFLYEGDPIASGHVAITLTQQRSGQREPPEGNLTWGSVLFGVESAFGIDSVATSKEFYEDSEPVSGEVVMRGKAPEGATLTVRLTDYSGRILAENSAAAAPRRAFHFEVTAARTNLYRLEAEVYSDGLLVEARVLELPVRRINDNDFTLWMWPWGDAYDRASKLITRELAEAGVDGFTNVSVAGDDLPRLFARQNLFLVPYSTNYSYSGRGDPDTTGARGVRRPLAFDELGGIRFPGYDGQPGFPDYLLVPRAAGTDALLSTA